MLIQKRVQDVGKKIWEIIFLPWLKFVTSKRNSTAKRLKFQVNSTDKYPILHPLNFITTFFLIFPPKYQQIESVSGGLAPESWSLELVEIEGKETDGLTFILDTCRQLRSTLIDLSGKFFGLTDNDGHRLIDFCVPALKVFNVEMANSLLHECFIPNLPDALVNNADHIVESQEDEVPKVMV